MFMFEHFREVDYFFASFYFRDYDSIRENINPAKISTYTVYRKNDAWVKLACIIDHSYDRCIHFKNGITPN